MRRRRAKKKGLPRNQPRCELCNHPISHGRTQCTDGKRCKQRRRKQARLEKT